MKTLSEYLVEAMQRGNSRNFRVAGDRLIGWSADRYYTSQDVSNVGFFRFESYSYPHHSYILYLIETHDGLKGTLMHAYGIYIDSMISNFVNEIESDELKPRPLTH